MTTSMVVAADEDDVIGRDGGLPWHLPKDLRRFRALTIGHVVIAGRRTHQSIIDRLGHPLPGRFAVVVSRQAAVLPPQRDVSYQPDVRSALQAAHDRADGDVFVIGGAEIYRQTLSQVDHIYLTRIHAHVGGDTRMPAGWLSGYALVEEEKVTDDELPFSFLAYRRG
jgi:dihydrofolate reductase